MTRFVAAAMAFLLLAACASPPAPKRVEDQLIAQGFHRMSGEEIVAALVGNSLDGADKGGAYVIYYPEKGVMRIDYKGRKDTGVWNIRKNRYCRRWANLGNGKNRCLKFYRKGDRIYWVKKGKIYDRATLVPGNPAGL